MGGSITVRLVSSFTSLYSAAPLPTNNNMFSYLVKSSHVKLETSDKSYKASTLVNYDSRVVSISNLLVITSLES